jgi:hypothetical protein
LILEDWMPMLKCFSDEIVFKPKNTRTFNEGRVRGDCYDDYIGRVCSTHYKIKETENQRPVYQGRTRD